MHGDIRPPDRGRRQRRHRGTDSIAPTQLAARADDPGVARRLAVGFEDLAQGLAVPVLLEVPQRQKRRDLRIVVGGREEEVTQVQDGVIFDVVHVANAPERRLIQRLVAEGVEVDVVDGEPLDAVLVLIDREVHPRMFYTAPNISRQDSRPSISMSVRRWAAHAARLSRRRIWRSATSRRSAISC